MTPKRSMVQRYCRFGLGKPCIIPYALRQTGTNATQLVAVSVCGALLLFSGSIISGCSIIERSISVIEKFEADLDRGISTIANDNTRWRSTLQELAADIPDEVQSTVRIELQQLAARSTALAGTEIRCDIDFLARRAIQGLRRVRALLHGHTPEPLAPEVCQVSPATLDMNIERARRVDVSISGYDMDHVDSEGRRLRFVYVSDAGNQSFPFPEERIGRTHHYVVTLNTSGIDFDRFIYQNQINKIRAAWSDQTEPPEIIVTRWEPRQRNVTVPLGSFDFMPPHTHGDRDLDTGDSEPTDVNLAAETKLDGSRILSRVYMKARERDPDHTTAEGWSDWKIAYEAPGGWRIHGATRLGRSDASLVATTHDMRTVTLPQGEIADRFESWIDRRGNDAGVFTRTTVFLRPVDVVLEETPPF